MYVSSKFHKGIRIVAPLQVVYLNQDSLLTAGFASRLGEQPALFSLRPVEPANSALADQLFGLHPDIFICDETQGVSIIELLERLDNTTIIRLAPDGAVKLFHSSAQQVCRVRELIPFLSVIQY